MPTIPSHSAITSLLKISHGCVSGQCEIIPGERKALSLLVSGRAIEEAKSGALCFGDTAWRGRETRGFSLVRGAPVPNVILLSLLFISITISILSAQLGRVL